MWPRRWPRRGREAEEAIERLQGEEAALERQRRDDEGDLRGLAASPGTNGERLARLAGVQERIRQAERRLSEIHEELVALRDGLVEEQEVADALAEFDGVWAAWTPREQARILELLIERVEHDGQAGNVSITFRPTGIKTLATELTPHKEESAACLRN